MNNISRLKIFLVLLILVFVFSLSRNVFAQSVSFVSPPTPENGTTTTSTSITIQATSTQEGQHYILNDLDNSLVGWWRGEDGTIDVADEAGFNNVGDLIGATFDTDGKFGRAMSFDGGDFVDITSDESLEISDNFTMSAWVKPVEQGAGWKTIMANEWHYPISGILVSMDGTTGYVHVAAGDGDSFDYVDGDINIADGECHLVTVSFSSGTVKIYIDGELDLEESLESVSSVAYETDLFTIGKNSDDAIEFWKGLIDEVIIFNRVLSEGEILSLYNASTTEYSNTFSYDLADGEHTIMAHAIDLDGNKISTSERTFNIDLFAGGDGSSEDPYQIENCTQLQAIGGYSGRYLTEDFKLIDNINCSQTSTWNSNAGFLPIGNSTTPFTGHFDGNDKTISSLYINRLTTNYIGLFGYSTGEIKDLNLVTVDISGQARTGGLLGRLGIGGTIDNVDISGEIFGTSYIGGLVGGSLGSISNSNANVTVTGDENEGVRSYVGGLVGGSAGTINNCTSSGTVTALGWDTDHNFSNGGLAGVLSATGTITNSSSSSNVHGVFAVGGLVGSALGDISDSFATGDVIADDSYSGGLVGSLSGNVTDSYSTGNVDGSSAVGGLVGVADSEPSSKGNISDSYATGNVTNDNSSEWTGGLVGGTNSGVTRSWASGDVTASAGYKVGGLVGGLGGSLGSIYSSYATGNVIGYDNVGGLVGYNEGGHIENTYAVGNVTGYSASGGLVGKSFDKTIVNSYATGDVTGSIAGGLIGHLEGDFVYNSYSVSKIISSTDENLIGNYGQDHIAGGLIGLMLYREDESVGTFVFNCGWYKSEDNSSLSGIGLSGISGGDYAPADVSYAETNNDVFYSKDHGIYENAVEYTWDFNGDPWYEYANDYPKFTEGEVIPEPEVHHHTSGSYLPGYGPRINIAPVVAPTIPTTPETKFIFTKNLKKGMIDSDVKELQKFLNIHGYLVSFTGSGSKGFETTKFGSLTQKALIKFQLANKLKGDGIVGPLTRAVLNK